MSERITRRELIHYGVGTFVGAAAFAVGSRVGHSEKTVTVEKVPEPTLAEQLANKIKNNQPVKFLNGGIITPLTIAGESVTLKVQSPLLVEKEGILEMQKFDQRNYHYFALTLGPDANPVVTEILPTSNLQTFQDTYPFFGTIIEGTVTPGGLPAPDGVGRYTPAHRDYFLDQLAAGQPNPQKGGPIIVGAAEYDLGK